MKKNKSACNIGVTHTFMHFLGLIALACEA